jgi:hypothetical protein
MLYVIIYKIVEVNHMSAEDRSLPNPPSQAFSNKKPFENIDGKPLMADQIAMAAAGGKLEQFMKDEIPDSDHARKLVSMLMGMTGIMPPEGMTGLTAGTDRSEDRSSSPEPEAGVTPPGPPEDVLNAINTADLDGLKDLLKREHTKRTPNLASAAETGESPPPANTLPLVDKDVIDSMLKIASDNNLTPDWIILRALKLYIDEYNRTGRL